MAESYNGTGTTWMDGVYDANDKRPRSATEWGVFFDLPLWPYRRAVLSKMSHKLDSFSEETEYLILDERRLNLFEILFTYVWRWLVIAPFFLIACFTTLLAPLYLLVVLGQSDALSPYLPQDSTFLKWLLAGLFFIGWIVLTFVTALIFLFIGLLLRRIECVVLSIFDNGAEYEVD